MKNLLLVLLSLTSVIVLADTKTVALEVPTMNCATCPLTVKKALQKVDGVITAEVTYEDRLAVVIFDDEQTDAQALTEATKKAGYPSTIKN